MSRYVVGDVQGCFDSLLALMARVAFDPAKDRVWLAGDLVNRGPKSLAVLRWAREHAAITVLGNHDLHLIACALGVAAAKPRDTLDGVLAAPDGDALVDWLRAQPLVHREGDFTLVHAGLLPPWSLDDAAAEARILERDLRSSRESCAALLHQREGARAEALRAFTRLRMLDEGGRPSAYDGPPSEAPRGLVAWYAAPERRSAQGTVLFGHWSALGLHTGAHEIGLDTGCVWGRALTAYRLDDGAIFSQPAVETPRLE